MYRHANATSPHLHLARICTHALGVRSQGRICTGLFVFVIVRANDDNRKDTKDSLYVRGCHHGSVRITTDQFCADAATAFGSFFDRALNLPDYPRGCYQDKHGYFYFNVNAVGSANDDVTPFCQERLDLLKCMRACASYKACRLRS